MPLKGMEYILGKMEGSMKANGNKIKNMVMAFRLQAMVAYMKGNMNMIKNMDKEPTNGQMEDIIEEDGITVSNTDKVK